MSDPIPICVACKRPMQLHDENATTKLYLCGCNGEVKHLNVHTYTRKPANIIKVQHSHGH